MSFCSQCGTQLQAKWAYCGTCGAPVSGAAPTGAAFSHVAMPAAVPMYAPAPAWGQPVAKGRPLTPGLGGSGLGVTAGILGLVAAVLSVVPEVHRWSRLDYASVAELHGPRALLATGLLVTASVLCLVRGTRRLGAAGLAGLASGAVTYSAVRLVWMVVDVGDLLDFEPLDNITRLGGFVVLLGAAVGAAVVCLRTGASTRGSHLVLLLNGGALGLMFAATRLWSPVGGGWIFVGEPKYWVPTLLIQTLLPIGLVVVAALVVDRLVRLSSVASFALFWLLALWDWLEPTPSYGGYGAGSVTVAGWVSILAVLGLVALFAATVGMREPGEAPGASPNAAW